MERNLALLLLLLLLSSPKGDDSGIFAFATVDVRLKSVVLEREVLVVVAAAGRRRVERIASRVVLEARDDMVVTFGCTGGFCCKIAIASVFLF